MSVVLEIRRRGRDIAGPILGALLFSYFVLHAVQGNRGLLAWAQIKQQIDHAETALMGAATERSVWEQRISLIKGSRVDPDMLDERVRRVMGFARPDELIILNKVPSTTP
jgi:cell division protein FtsB